MQITVEISMYPLQVDYEPPILDFIQRLNKHPNLRVETNTMSTQIFGEYDQVMSVLNQEMKRSLAEERTTIMVMKVLRVDG